MSVAVLLHWRDKGAVRSYSYAIGRRHRADGVLDGGGVLNFPLSDQVPQRRAVSSMDEVAFVTLMRQE